MEIIGSEGINAPEYLDRATKPAVTFAHIVKEWEEKRLPMLYPSSQTIVLYRLRKFTLPYFRDMEVNSIRTGVVNDFIGHLTAKGLQPKTVHNAFKEFRSVVNWHRKQLDQPRVCWYPDLPALPEDEQRWFTMDEINRIVAAAEGQYAVFFRLAGYSGLRCGELCGLRVEDIDFARGMVHVRRSVWRGMEGQPIESRII